MYRSARVVFFSFLAVVFSGCSTKIYDKNDTIRPSTMPFSKFSNVVLAPLVVERSGGDAGDRRAVEHIRDNLTQCFNTVFKSVTPTTPGQAAFAPNTLVIEPAIEDLKKVNVAERVFVGPLAGASAVLLRTRYRNGDTGEEILSPVFYSKSNSMAGTMTVGTTDNIMLTRVVNLACDYARNNQ